VAADRLPAAPSAFYRRVSLTLEKMDFARQVWAICEPAYADPGRAGIEPVVYLKMLMIGFFWKTCRATGLLRRVARTA
jgi:hypothetical protein